MTDDILVRSDNLDEQMPSAIRKLEHGLKLNRIMIYVGMVSFVFDLALTFIVGLEARQAHEVAMQASSLRQQVYATCLASNDSRARELALWTHVLSITPTQDQTPVQQQHVREFEAYVQALYAPRKCVR